MENLKIKVNSKAESKEVQDLLVKMGYHARANWNERNPIHESIQAWSDGEFTFSLNHNQVPVGFKEVTLPKLRAMANQDQDEPFHTPETTLNDQYAEIEEVRQAIREEAQAASGIDATLAERQTQYGCYEDVAHVTQEILKALRVGGYDRMPAPHKEAMHMIASKMARIVNGDFNHLDSWHDIGGYSKLIEKLIKGE